MQRKGKDALHFVPCEVNEPPFGVGEEVQQTIDWDRRFDHMQQHSGLSSMRMSLFIVVQSVNSKIVCRTTLDNCNI